MTEAHPQEPWPEGAIGLRDYFEALLHEHLRAIEIAEREREKAAQALRDNLREQIRSGDVALERHIDAQIQSVKLALDAQDKFATEVQRSAKEAVEKALEASKEIAHKHNELIAQQDRDKEKFATKIDLGHMREVITKVNDDLKRTDGFGREKVGRVEYEKAEDAWGDIQRVVDQRLVNVETSLREQQAVNESLATYQRERKTDSGVTIGQVIAVVTVIVTIAAILVGAFT